MYKHAYDEGTVYIRIFRNLGVVVDRRGNMCNAKVKYEIGDFVIQDGLI